MIRKASICVVALALASGCLEFPEWDDDSEEPAGAEGEGEGEGAGEGTPAEVEGDGPSSEGEGEAPGEGEDCAFGPTNPDAEAEEQWVQVCPGEFQMGSPEGEADRGSNEPQHRVEITRPFLLRATEVTQAEWEDVMGVAPSTFKECGDDCPVERVSWFEVVEFCNALSAREGREECYVAAGDNVTWPRGLDCTGYRLPTEAEWEYAERAGTQTAWSCGADAACLDGVAWYDENSGDTTHPVGTKAANAWGLYDMHGNVWEWVWDRYADDYADGQVDPTGPAAGASRVRRGGGWYDDASRLRAAHRNRSLPTGRSRSLGFRPARSVP